jgi:hypothetical protein
MHGPYMGEMVFSSLTQNFIDRPTTSDDWPLLAESACSLLALPYQCQNLSISDVVERIDEEHWLTRRMLTAFPGATHTALHIALLAVLLHIDEVDAQEMGGAGDKLLAFCPDDCVAYAHSTGWSPQGPIECVKKVRSRDSCSYLNRL